MSQQGHARLEKSARLRSEPHLVFLYKSKRMQRTVTVGLDFTSQDYLRNPAAGIERLRVSGPIVEVRFPIIGRTWITTTQEAAERILKDSRTFTIRNDSGEAARMFWWMPGIFGAVHSNTICQ